LTRNRGSSQLQRYVAAAVLHNSRSASAPKRNFRKLRNMIRTTLSIALIATFAVTAIVKAEPPASSKKRKTNSTVKAEAATTLPSGWTYANGVWTHVDGYKLINGQVVRSGTQTHKKAPPPPTKAEMEAVMKKKPAVKTPAEIAAEKEAQRQRNLAPRPASQTGTHL
jgi:hypothetical protein